MKKHTVHREHAKTKSARNLRTWLRASGSSKTGAVPRADHQRKKTLQKWIKPNAGYNWADLVYRADLEAERLRFISEKPV